VLKKGEAASTEEIVAHCLETLPSFKVPVRVLFVDGIPKTERGKLAKETLLGMLDRPTSAPAPAETADSLY